MAVDINVEAISVGLVWWIEN